MRTRFCSSAALSPLPCWTLPFVLAAFHQTSSTGFAELSRRGFVPPPRTPQTTAPLCVLPAHRHCSLCNNDLYLQPARVARMLAYKSGIEEVLFRVESCEACGLCYLGCMSYKSSGDLYLCSDPGSAAVLPWAMPSQAPATSSECPFLFVQANFSVSWLLFIGAPLCVALNESGQLSSTKSLLIALVVVCFELGCSGRCSVCSGTRRRSQMRWPFLYL